MARKSAKARDELKITTPVFRGSFVTLFNPRAMGDDDPKYSITIVLPKDSPFWDKLDKITDKCAKRKWDTIPKKLDTTVKDGDESEYEEWEGCYAVPARSLDKPGIVDADCEPITDRSEVYSGAHYRAVIRVYAWFYPKANKKGVSLQLDNVMKVKDDEPFSGRSSATDDFADFVDRDPDDDEEERPSRRRSRSRSRDDDEEEEETRPSRRRSRSRSRRSSPLD
jgi:hypothetical protein